MQQFLSEISGAQLVHYEEAEQVLFVWHGGLCVTIYNDELVQLDCFNMMEASNVEQVRDAIRRHVDDYYGSLEDEHDYRRSIDDYSDDGDALASAGMGTDEDYGYYGGDD